MKNTHETIENKITVVTETKLKMNPHRKLVTVKKKTKGYVDDLWLKFLKEAGVIDGYKLTRQESETEIHLTFVVEE